MCSPINRNLSVMGILLAGTLCAAPATAFDEESVVTEGSKAATMQACVAPTADIRRNHMKYLKHQRHRTVHQGIRGSKFSITGCVNCHAAVNGEQAVPINADGQFCQRCHSYAAVTITCFQCHRKVPAQKREPLTGSPADLHQGLSVMVEHASPHDSDDLAHSMPVAQED